MFVNFFLSNFVFEIPSFNLPLFTYGKERFELVLPFLILSWGSSFVYCIYLFLDNPVPPWEHCKHNSTIKK
jgi:hypothetical protein